MAYSYSRRYSKQAQINYHPKCFKLVKTGVWLTILLIAMCAVALVVR